MKRKENHEKEDQDMSEISILGSDSQVLFFSIFIVKYLIFIFLYSSTKIPVFVKVKIDKQTFWCLNLNSKDIFFRPVGLFLHFYQQELSAVTRCKL